MSDLFLERLQTLSASGRLRPLQLAYMRDVTLTMHHDIQCFTPGAQVAIGRAYTVKGPDI